MNRPTKLVVGFLFIFVITWLAVHQLYNYYKKFNETGISPVKSALYAIGITVLLGMLAGASDTGNILNFILFDSIYNIVVKAV